MKTIDRMTQKELEAMRDQIEEKRQNGGMTKRDAEDLSKIRQALKIIDDSRSDKWL